MITGSFAPFFELLGIVSMFVWAYLGYQWVYNPEKVRGTAFQLSMEHVQDEQQKNFQQATDIPGHINTASGMAGDATGKATGVVGDTANAATGILTGDAARKKN